MLNTRVIWISNTVLDGIALLIRIWEVVASDFVPDAGYSEFPRFYQLSPNKAEDSAQD